MEPQSFQQDLHVLAHELHRRGRLTRRQFGRALAGLAAIGALPSAARAAQELVMVNWGGLANKGFGENYGAPFMAAHPGVTVAQDSTGPSAGRIRSMVQSGKVTWDLCDSSASSALLLGKEGLATAIDYSVVNKADVADPSFVMEYGAAPYSFSSVLVYDSEKFKEPPTGWKDFWDLKKFPGTRLLRKDPLTSLDAAMVSLGADPKTMYPLKEKDALKRIAEIRKDCLYWANGSESEQFIRTGEAVMGCIWHTRASVLAKESKGRFKFIWNEGMLQAGIFVIPKNNPGGALAQQLLASMLANAAGQVALLKLLGNGPTNPKAAPLVSEADRAFNPTDPANAKAQFVMDPVWWAANYTRLTGDFLDVITG